MVPNSRRMRFPYTYTAKIAQFPYKHYYKHSWVFKYMIFSTLICMPIFYKIQKLSYAPENVKKWAELDRKALEGEH